jgi:aspartate/methionine/tyrosine aminotransferase
VVYYGPPPLAFQAIDRFTVDPENHKYKLVQGIPPLLSAIAGKLERENGIPVSPANALLVTAGGNMAFMNAILAITDPGDEVILPTPYYFNHEMAIVMAGCHPVLVPTDSGNQLRLDALEAAISPRTRAIVTVSPNNPTGAVYPPEALRAVNTLCARRGLYHISDEAYEYFVYPSRTAPPAGTPPGPVHFSPASIPGSAGHTLSLFSLSKAYGFASWRIGYMVVPDHLVTSVKKIQDTILICAPVISQFAAAGALEAGRAYCQEHLREIARIRDLFLAELETIRPFCEVPPADGAFYFLLKLDTRLDAMAVVERLVREHGVAAIPGPAFGATDGCRIRVAYAALPHAPAIEGVRRLVRGLRAIVG